MTRVVAVIQARMGSTRLPGKVLMPLAGEPMLARVVARARRTAGIAEVMVATSVNPEEAPIVAWCAAEGVRCARGSADDVLARYALAARESRAEAVVRITSDCPLIAPEVCARVVAALAAGGADYASNVRVRTWPRGLDCECFTADALAVADRDASAQPEREHVTQHFLRNPDRFRLRDVVDDVDRSALRWTVDTPDDLALARRIYDAFGGRDDFAYAEALDLVARHPDWTLLNAHVEQKKIGG